MQDIASQFNKSISNDIKMQVLGSTERRSCEIIVNALELPISVDQFQITFKKKTMKKLASVELMNGAEKLIKHFHKSGIPIAIGTSSGAPGVEIKTARHRPLFDLFHHIVCGSTDPEVKEGKPAPDIFLLAAQRFSDVCQPENVRSLI